jgi:hypothetical protein
MHSDFISPFPVATDSSSRRLWVAPVLTTLPPLTALTLQSGAPIDGSGTPSGVIFSLLSNRGPFRVG